MKKRKRSVGSSDVHDISNDEKGAENIVEGIKVSWRNGVLVLHMSCYKFKEKVDHDITKNKSATNRDQLTTEAADSYDSGFNQALEQIKKFYPEVDVSVYDVLKEVVDEVLVDLIVGEADGGGEETEK
ncbi:hypothetical protein SESBI_45774 [Sesbania bispinosa]|nr:hypothetical protein SESBI_45774 [Sesbania bispinosa]